jgi:V-type H+-transporting ATPase subunit F
LPFSKHFSRRTFADFTASRVRRHLASRGRFSSTPQTPSAWHVGWHSSGVMDKGEGSLIGVIGDEDTVTGFLLAGVGNVDVRRNTNFLVVDGKTTKKAIEDAFKDFTTREDIAVVLINQTVADQIRYLVDEHTAPVPAVLEVPSKDAPYDATKDSILSRVQHLLGVAE